MNPFPFVQTYNPNLNCWVDNMGMPIQDKQGNISVTQPESVSLNKALFLKDKAQIETLTSINGISINEIENRARPGGLSYAGFIGENENFKEVLKKDWETVEKLNVTHLELADHLANIISIAKSADRSSKRGIFDPIVIEYRTQDLKGNTISSDAPQKLEVLLLQTKGAQEDLFGPNDDSQREVNTPKRWNEEDSVKNMVNGVELFLNSGILSYIREFGFYEGGGKQNRYRVDPMQVIALLTGK